MSLLATHSLHPPRDTSYRVPGRRHFVTVCANLQELACLLPSSICVPAAMTPYDNIAEYHGLQSRDEELLHINTTRDLVFSHLFHINLIISAYLL
jgi:hypothetical protein